MTRYRPEACWDVKTGSGVKKVSVLFWNDPAQVGFMSVYRVDYEHGASEAPPPHTSVR